MTEAPAAACPGRSAAFTLVALLVVIAVISILIALLPPVVSSPTNGSPVYGSLGRKPHRPWTFLRASIGTSFSTGPHTHVNAHLICLEQWLHLDPSDGKRRW